jgi:hypothetical protein
VPRRACIQTGRPASVDHRNMRCDLAAPQRNPCCGSPCPHPTCCAALAFAVGDPTSLWRLPFRYLRRR